MKRKLLCIALCVALFLGLSVTARADNAASAIQIYASLNSGGDAEVTLTARIYIEEAVDSLSFPLPLNASDITLNNKNVSSSKYSNATWVSLPDISGFVGEYVATFDFRINDVVSMVGEKLTLELPLLSGFEYPVESVNLTVMMPGVVESRPTFKSIYHQDSIESILAITVNNNLINGLITTTLKDRETLSMSMVVPEEMFSGVSTYVREGNPETVPMGVCAALAFLYWLLFLRTLPFLRTRRATAPEGITAGELGNRLTLSGADLTMMVFTWAQLGYLSIQLEDSGRVLLRKRMDMGNERSSFEVKVFKLLFGNKTYTDATGSAYARLADRVSRSVPGRKILLKGKHGSLKPMRILSCGVQLFCGVCFAMNLLSVTALQVIAAIGLGALGALSAWFIQEGMFRIHLRYKKPLVISLVLAAAWIGLSVWAGQWVLGLLSAGAQLLCGLAGAYGGRRTDLGRQNAGQILGLRSYYKNLSKEDINRLLKNDPEYFFNNISFAMALGVDKAFAQRFGNRKMPRCPYFTCGVRTAMTATDWCRFLHETAEIMDERYRQLQQDKYAIIRIR